MIIRFFHEGGASFMFLIYLMWIIVCALAIRFVFLYRANASPQKLLKLNESILFVGSFAFLWGITGQIVGLMSAFDFIQSLGDDRIDPLLLAGGLKVSFIPPLLGLLLLLVSALIWYVFRNLKRMSPIAPQGE